MIIQGRLEQETKSDRRSLPRRRISLGSNLRGTGDAVLIHDFSSTGMLIETTAKLPLFDGIEIDLPEAGNTHAIVIWNSGRYYGCEFREPLPRAAISAALLRSQPKTSNAPSKPRPFVVVEVDAPKPEALHDEGPADTFEDDKAALSVRLRVILGSAILLWGLIILAAWSLIKLVR